MSLTWVGWLCNNFLCVCCFPWDLEGIGCGWILEKMQISIMEQPLCAWFRGWRWTRM